MARRLRPRRRPWRRPIYACWVEQQHENFQPRDIAYCRDGFYKNMKILNDAVIPVAPETTSLQADAFFDFDKYFIREDAKPELDRIADVMIADTQTQFLVWGFTDTVGTRRVQPGPVRASRQCRGRLPRGPWRVA